MPSSVERLSVAEIFGPTIQGEGPSMGRTAMFVRLSGCNLACSWCDTPYTWKWTEYDKAVESKIMDVREVRNVVMSRGFESRTFPHILVITGGEPLLQQGGIVNLLSLVGHKFDRVEIETNGTQSAYPSLANISNLYFNVSPKLANSGADHPSVRDLHPYWHHSSKAIFKFVVKAGEDFYEIEKMHLENSKIWIMPEGITQESMTSKLAKAIAREAIERGWNFSTRMHVLLWGNERGR